MKGQNSYSAKNINNKNFDFIQSPQRDKTKGVYTMSLDKTSYSAKFINYEILNKNFHYKRLNFTNVRNRNGDLVKYCLCIDESESLKIIGHLSYGEIVNFVADENFQNIEFCYPHGTNDLIQ